MNRSKIMIVENDKVEASEIKQQVEKFGYDISLVKNNGEQTIKQVIDKMPDLVIIENDPNGIETVKMIKLWREIPVLYFTLSDDLDKALHTEPYGFIFKPYDDKTLFASIETAIRRNKLYKKVKESEAQYHAISDAFDGFIYINDNNYNVVFANENLKARSGKKLIDDKCYKAIYGLNKPCSWCPMEKILSGKLFRKERFDVKENKWYDEVYAPVYFKEGYIYNQTISYDITSIKSRIEQQNDTIKQHEIILKEIHHRIKNNLQIITSFLNIQSLNIADKNSKQILRESSSRVNSIILIHDKLYNTNHYTSIDFEDYLRKLTSNLMQLYSPEKLKVNFTINAQNIILDVDTAIAAGLIVNELVTNSLKHAFNHNISEGNIEISLKQIGKGEYNLWVTDNGTGMPDYKTPEDNSALGMKIISALTKQLAGEIKIKADKGTETFIKFKRAGVQG